MSYILVTNDEGILRAREFTFLEEHDIMARVRIWLARRDPELCSAAIFEPPSSNADEYGECRVRWDSRKDALLK